MELPMIHEASLRVLVLSTIFLKEAAASGHCLSKIGDMMSRQFTKKEEEPSVLEVMCMEARNWVKEIELLLQETDFEEEEEDDDDSDANFTQFDLDSADDSTTCEIPFFLTNIGLLGEVSGTHFQDCLRETRTMRRKQKTRRVKMMPTHTPVHFLTVLCLPQNHRCVQWGFALLEIEGAAMVSQRIGGEC